MKLDKINNVLIIVILIIIFKIIYNFLQNKNNIETFYNWKLNNDGKLCNYANDNFGSCYNIALIENGNIIDVHGGSAVIVDSAQGSRGDAGAQGADGHIYHTFNAQSGTVACENIGNFIPVSAKWWGGYIGGSPSTTFHEIESDSTSKKYIAMYDTTEHCKMIELDVVKNGSNCKYSIGSAGYTDGSCAATTEKIITRWGERTGVDVARTPDAKGYGFESITFRRTGADGSQGAVGADGSQNFMVNKLYYLFNLTQNTFVRLNGGHYNTQSYLRNTTLVPTLDPSEALNVNFRVKVRPLNNITDELNLVYGNNYYITIRNVDSPFDSSHGYWGYRKLKLKIGTNLRVAAAGHHNRDGQPSEQSPDTQIYPFRFKFINDGMSSNQFKIEHSGDDVSLGQLKAVLPSTNVYGNEYDFVNDNTGDVFTFIDPEITGTVEQAIHHVRVMTPLAGAGADADYTPNIVSTTSTDLVEMYNASNAFNNVLYSSPHDPNGFWHSTSPQITNISSDNTIDIEVTFNTPQIVTMYRIWARPDFKSQAPRRWKLIGIPDINGTEDVLDDQNWVASVSYPDTVNNTRPSDNPHTALEFSFNNTTKYKKYVFSIRDTNDTDYCSIGELGLYGTEILGASGAGGV